MTLGLDQIVSGITGEQSMVSRAGATAVGAAFGEEYAWIGGILGDSVTGIGGLLKGAKNVGELIANLRKSGEIVDFLKKLSPAKLRELWDKKLINAEDLAKADIDPPVSTGANATKSPQPAPPAETPAGSASSSAAKEGVDGAPGTPGTEGGNANPVPTGEPVDLITGNVFADEEDFTLPWHIPLAWKRFYSSDSRRWGAMGVGWESPADFRLTLRSSGEVAFWAGKGGGDIFAEMPEPGACVVQPKEGARLERAADQVSIHTRSGLTYCFPPPAPQSKELALLSIQDQNGNSLTFIRHNGVLAEIRNSAGPWLELQGGDGLTQAIILHHPAEPPRLLVRYRHSAARDLIAVEDALGVPHTFEYRNHCLIRHTDRNGVSFQYQYDREDATGRCIRTWGDNGLHDTHIQYDLPNRRATATDSRGLVTTIETDTEQRLRRKEDSSGQVTTYEYDSGGRVSTVTDVLGRRVGYRYDALGNLLAVTRPDGAVLQWTYDTRQHLTAFTDAAGATWRQEWDAQGRLVLQLSPLGAVRQYRYDARGDLVAFVDPRYGTTRLEPDPTGAGPRALIDPTGRARQWRYDGLGHITAAVDPAGAVSRFSYDAKGRLTRIQRPSGTEVHCGYDRELNLTSYIDELGHETRFDYGFVNRLTARHLPNGTTVRYDYDTENRLTAVINGRGERYSLLRDPAGRITAEIDYWGRLSAYRYDAAGQLIERVDPLGRLTRLERDPLGRLSARHFADDSVERFEYDTVGNLIATESPHGRVTRRFDAEGRLSAEDQAGFQVRFDYDLAGNLNRRTSSADNRVDYAYDAADRLTAIRVNGETIHRIEHDARGLPVHEVFGAGLHRHSEFDPECRLTRRWTESPFNTLLERGYRYDAAGNLLQRIDPAKGTQGFDYDPIGNLIRYTDPEGRISDFLRDAAGDFLRPEAANPPDERPGPETGGRPRGGTEPVGGTDRSAAGGATAPAGSGAAPDPRDRLGIPLRPIPGREPYGAPVRGAWFGDLHYRYDAAGNVIERTTKAGTQRLDWDCANRLIRARGTDQIPIWFGYDAQGRRLSKTRQGQTTRFGWDGDALMAEHDGKGWREYLYAPDGFTPLALVEGGKVYHYETDQVGCPHEVLDGEGRIVWSAQYDAWGGTTRITTERVRNPLRLQGQYWDDEIGVAYNRYRYYDPRSGGFLSQDPLAVAAGDNLYAGAPNFQGWVDPLGLKSTPPPTNAEGLTHGNSATSTRAQHGYEIVDTNTGQVVKVGVSGGPRTAAGGSRRADTQANRWNRGVDKPGLYEGRVVAEVPEGPGSRQAILDWERERSQELRDAGQLLDPTKHARP
jgi:RHS repeat-associated protein